MYIMKIHKGLKNGPINKNIPFQKEKIMQNANISSEMSLEFFKIPKQGAKPEKLAKNDLK